MREAVLLTLVVCALGAPPAAAQNGEPVPELHASFWSGTRRRAALGVTVRTNGSLNLSTIVDRQDVTLPEGDFATTLMSMNHNWINDAGRRVTLSRGATTKLNYTHRF